MNAPVPFVSCLDLPREPDAVTAWIKLDIVTRRIVGQRMEQGPTRETNAALDRVMVLRAWTGRRMVN